jgi:uncharacterized protein (DUF1015 family)
MTIRLDPIVALVADAERCAAIVAPSYDGFSGGGRYRYAMDHPDSFMNVILSGADLPSDESNDVPARASAAFNRMLEAGLYEPHPEPGFFLYELEAAGHRQLGVMAAVSNEHISAGRVLGHEATMAARTDELAQFYRASRISSSAVALTYHDDGGRFAEVIESIAGSSVPIRSFESPDGVSQRLWHITDPTRVAAIADAAGAIERLYITDGHHRVSAAATGATGPSFLGVVFPAAQLHVLEYNRCVELDRPVDDAKLFAELAAGWHVEELGMAGTVDPRPAAVGEIAMLVHGHWYRLRALAIPVDPLDGLDVEMLHSRVIRPLFGVADDGDARLSFVVGDGAIARLEAICSTDRHLGFALHPTALDQLMRIADAGETMPPKSTYFTPKARSGLVVVRW